MTQNLYLLHNNTLKEILLRKTFQSVLKEEKRLFLLMELKPLKEMMPLMFSEKLQALLHTEGSIVMRPLQKWNKWDHSHFSLHSPPMKWDGQKS